VISARYFDSLTDILTQIATQQAAHIQSAGMLVANAIAAGGVVQTFGSGHSHMISEEAFFRAGGLAPVNPILDDALIFLHGALESTRAERQTGYAATVLIREEINPADVAIVISNSGRNAVPIEMALHLKELGLKVIAITNPRQAGTSASRHSSGKYLFEIADLVIDNCIPVGDAVLELPGLPQKMGPSSTVAGAAIMNAIMIEAAACLQTMGLRVPVISSANVGAGALADMQASLAHWESRVRLLGDVQRN
jgi:uncharacterized phosphosugar-binding protein